MAVEIPKVLSAIELKFKGKSITKDFKKALATKWAAKIDNDADIDTYIDDREDVILEASAEGDRRATAAGKVAKTEVIKKVTGEETTTEDEPTDEMGKLMKIVSGLAQTVETMQKNTTKQTLEQQFKADPRLKGIPEKLLKGRIPATEAELEAAIAETAEELADFKVDEQQQQQQTSFGTKTDKPVFGGGVQTPKVGEQKGLSKDAQANIDRFTKSLPGNTQATKV